MSIIRKMLKQDGVYWPPAGTDQYSQPLFGAPVAVKVRWEDGTEEFMDPATGQKVLSTAKVFVGQDVAVGGKLALCTLASLGQNPSNVPTAAARKVRAFGKVPDLKAKEFLRTAMLV